MLNGIEALSHRKTRKRSLQLNKQKWTNQHLCEQDRRLADEENFNDLNKRAEAALTFLEKRPESHILVVGHGLFVRILIGRAVLGKDYTGRDCEHFIKTFRTTNTGITILQYQPEDAWGPWRVLAWNDHAHLG